MTSTYALNSLIRKRAELAGDLERHESSVRQLKIDLANLDATILLFDPNTDLGKIKPKPLPAHMGANKGGVAHIVFGLLRTAERPCTVREVALHVMAERGMDTTNVRLMATMVARMASTLRHYRKRGLLRSFRVHGEYDRWAVATND
jgi:hypothetical protein